MNALFLRDFQYNKNKKTLSPVTLNYSQCNVDRATLRWGSQAVAGSGSECDRMTGRSHSTAALLHLYTRDRTPCDHLLLPLLPALPPHPGHRHTLPQSPQSLLPLLPTGSLLSPENKKTCNFITMQILWRNTGTTNWTILFHLILYPRQQFFMFLMTFPSKNEYQMVPGFSLKSVCSSVGLGGCDSRSEGSSTCPRGLSQAQAQGTPGGTLEDRYRTEWSLLPADTPRSSPDGQSHSHRHPHHPALRETQRVIHLTKLIVTLQYINHDF